MPPRKLKKDGTPRKPRSGWGPYRSVARERSVAFNLQLDVQNLQQEVHNLLALRDILQAKALVRRDSPEGSLCRLVNEYLFVFRKGVVPPTASGGLRLVEDRDQRAFMHSVMDPDVDLGPGLPRGPDVILDQMVNYTSFLRFVSFSGFVDSIVTADDSVLVSDAASFVFQVTRSTLELIFPHIIGDEWLVAQLVGRQLEAQGRSTFHFNQAGKCFRYDVEMDFVGAFMGVVKDPRIIEILFGRALITENGMIGIMDEPDVEGDEDEEKAPATLPNEAGEQENDSSVGQRSRSGEFCQRIVKDYFAAFASGFCGHVSADPPMEAAQRHFFAHRFGAPKEVGTNTTLSDVKDRWRALSKCFEVLRFQQMGAAQTDCGNADSFCVAESKARYVLRITLFTIQSVFPHVVGNKPLLDALVGKVVVVPSHLVFSIEKNTGYISRIDEQMEFAVAMADIVPDEDELSFVLSQALLTENGVAPLEERIELPRLRESQEQSGSDSRRRITMADLLS